MTQFDGVIAPLAQALTKRGYSELTQVQQAVLAPELASEDLLVSAQTGSGKTVAFGMAFAPTLLKGEDRFPRTQKLPSALIIAPTRELALQVKGELEWLYAATGAHVVSCVGGMDMRAERRALERGAHIVVGTPGRLRDHVERGSFDTSQLKAITLDEADEMLDMGFREELEFIPDAAPADRRTLMFSATVSRPIATLAKRYQRDAKRISTKAETEQHKDIEYRALTMAPNDRENAIINVLRYYDAKNAIIFCATRATVNHLTSRFNNRGFSVVALSGELSQNERLHALQALRDGRANVCVATDVAARGIDLPGLDLVIHADLPKSKEPLLHRSGRTGRAGRKGVSALIVPHNWRKRAERLLHSARLEAVWAKPPTIDEILARDKERFLTNPAFGEDVQDDEQGFVKELLDLHGPEKIAAALVRLHYKAQPAPEELLDTGPEPKTRGRAKANADFEDGVWISLSVGRAQQAEPRWLIPLLCRVGHMTKAEIGAIRIQQNESYIELANDAVDAFIQAVGPTGKMEKTIEVTRLDGMPELKDDMRGKKFFPDKKPGGRGGNSGRGRSDRSRGGDRNRSDQSSNRKESGFRDKPNAGRAASGDAPRRRTRDDKFEDKLQALNADKQTVEKKKPKDKKAKKKPHKKKLARAAAKAQNIAKSGMAPLTRK